jgi:uncharacterized protein (TIGR03083 family)
MTGMKISPRYDGPPLISIDGPADDQLAPVVRQRRRTESMLAELSDREWSTPSRCEGWSVQDVIAHIVGVNTFWEASVRAGLAGNPTRMLVGFDPATTPALMVGGMRALTANEVFDQFVSSNDGFLGAITGLDDAGWSMLAEAPPGHIPIRLLVSHGLWDAWIHERDIAFPLGITPPVEADEVLASLRYAAALSPGFLLSVDESPGGVFAVEVTDPAASLTLELGDCVVVHDGLPTRAAPCLRGDAVEIVEALSIRAPLPDSAPPEWHALLRGLGAAFDAPSTVS